MILTASHFLFPALVAAVAANGCLAASLWKARKKLRVACARLSSAESARSRMGRQVVDTSDSLDDLTSALRFSRGGVGRRIQECRQVAKTIQQHAPVLFEVDKDLLHNLALMDEFLVDLHLRYQKVVDGDEHQMRIANAVEAEVYKFKAI